MKLLITGASGFVGSNFIKMSPDIVIRQVDLINQRVNDIDFTSIDVILHLAAIVHQKRNIPENKYFSVNRDLTYEIALNAKKNGVRHFVFMSTIKVYGDSHTDYCNWDESSECIPVDPYGKSKLEAEKLLLNLQDDNFIVSIVRSPLVYGPGVKANMYNLIKLVDNSPFLPFGGIENKRSIVFIGNLIFILRKIILNKEKGIYIAGDRTPMSTTEIVGIIADNLNKKRYIFKLPRIFRFLIKIIFPNEFCRLYGSLVVNNLHTNNVINFTPPYTSQQGLKEMVKWYLLLKNKNRH